MTFRTTKKPNETIKAKHVCVAELFPSAIRIHSYTQVFTRLELEQFLIPPSLDE